MELKHKFAPTIISRRIPKPCELVGLGVLEDIEPADIQSVVIDYIRKDVYDDLLTRLKKAAEEITNAMQNADWEKACIIDGVIGILIDRIPELKEEALDV